VNKGQNNETHNNPSLSLYFHLVFFSTTARSKRPEIVECGQFIIQSISPGSWAAYDCGCLHDAFG